MTITYAVDVCIRSEAKQPSTRELASIRRQAHSDTVQALRSHDQHAPVRADVRLTVVKLRPLDPSEIMRCCEPVTQGVVLALSMRDADSHVTVGPRCPYRFIYDQRESELGRAARVEVRITW